MSNYMLHDIEGLMLDCSNSIANALELLQPCTKYVIHSHNWVLFELTCVGKGDPLSYSLVQYPIDTIYLTLLMPRLEYSREN